MPFDRITPRPDVCSGKPCVRDLQVPVSRLLGLLAAEAWLEEGSAVELFVERGTLHVRPLRTHRYALRELLKKVTPRNLHREVSGRATGREVW